MLGIAIFRACGITIETKIRIRPIPRARPASRWPLCIADNADRKISEKKAFKPSYNTNISNNHVTSYRKELPQ